MHDAPVTMRSGMHFVDGILMVQAPDDFCDETLERLKKDVISIVHEHAARSVVVDVSTIEVIDSVAYGFLTAISTTSKLLGARTIFSGFQPGVVAALIDLDIETDSLETTREVADAIALLTPPPPEPEPEDEDIPDEDAKMSEDEPVDDSATERDIESDDTADSPKEHYEQEDLYPDD